MHDAVLISIRPRWCALIASGNKTIEVRRTRPDLPPPFKCYIYCTVGAGKKDLLTPCNNTADIRNGKVIGEFTCNEIDDYVLCGGLLYEKRYVRMDRQFYAHSINYPAMCLSEDEFADYAAGRKMHGWHISKLTIYDEPRELTDFWKPCEPGDPDAEALCYECTRDWENFCGKERITRAPQSWRYVEELA